MASAGSFHHPEVNVKKVPDFVAQFERELQSKAGLGPDAYNTYKNIRDVQFLDEYFGSLKSLRSLFSKANPIGVPGISR